MSRFAERSLFIERLSTAEHTRQALTRILQADMAMLRLTSIRFGSALLLHLGYELARKPHRTTVGYSSLDSPKSTHCRARDQDRSAGGSAGVLRAEISCDSGLRGDPGAGLLSRGYGNSRRASLSRLTEIPGRIDLVNVFRRSHDIGGHVEEILAKRPSAVWFQSGIRNAAAAETLAKAGIKVVQDRCLMVEHKRIAKP